MNEARRLLCVLAHPDDESLATGGILARYAAEGVATYLITATRGERGWQGDPRADPGSEALGQLREAELRAAAQVLGLPGMLSRLQPPDPSSHSVVLPRKDTDRGLGTSAPRRVPRCCWGSWRWRTPVGQEWYRHRGAHGAERRDTPADQTFRVDSRFFHVKAARSQAKRMLARMRCWRLCIEMPFGE
jgi:hypothetical protein